MSKTLIRVGHSAYTNANAMRLCFSKAQAVRVLCNRGVKRDIARKAVNEATKTPYSGACVDGEHFSAIEITNQQYAMEAGHYSRSYSELRSMWAGQSEL